MMFFVIFVIFVIFEVFVVHRTPFADQGGGRPRGPHRIAAIDTLEK